MLRRCTDSPVLFALAMAFVAAGLQAQDRGGGTIAGAIVSGEGGAPLAYTVVALPTLGRERFANEAGKFVFADLPAGRTVLRVRRLGFEPTEVAVNVRAGHTDTVRVELKRVAVRLAAVEVQALPPCLLPGPPRASRDSTLATIYAQLLLNAEQFKLLSKEYPFSLVLVSTFSHRNKDGGTQTDEVDTLRVLSDGGWKYQPGKVLAFERRGGSNRAKVTFLIPTLANFADPDFARSHCFHSGGVAMIEDSTYIRIDMVAAERIKTTDVNGSILLDPTTFQIRRTILRLTRINVPGLTEAEVVTDFRELLPSIPVIGRVTSTQTLDPKKRGFVGAFEEKQLVDYVFLGQKPGEDRKP